MEVTNERRNSRIVRPLTPESDDGRLESDRLVKNERHLGKSDEEPENDRLAKNERHLEKGGEDPETDSRHENNENSGGESDSDSDDDEGPEKEEGEGKDDPSETTPDNIYKIFEEIEEGTLDCESAACRYRVAACLHARKDYEETVLHKLINRLEPWVEVGSRKKANYDRLKPLAKVALEIDPSLLKAHGKNKLTPLQSSIVNKSMDDFTQYICNVVWPKEETTGREMNLCQEAIHCKNEKGQTCLRFAIVEQLDISSYLVERAHVDSFTEQSGKEGNTPLHDAVAFRPLRSKHLDLVKTIVQKHRETLLQLNNNGLSPYRYYVIKTREYNSLPKDTVARAPQAKIPVNDKDKGERNPKAAAAKEDDATRNHVKKGGTVADGKTGIKDSDKATTKDGEKAGKKSGDKVRAKGNRNSEAGKNTIPKPKPAFEMERFLRENCLNYSGFPEAFRGIWGSTEGNPKTWLNLLRPLSPEFKVKYKFLKLEKELGFVGVRVPANIESRGTGTGQKSAVPSPKGQTEEADRNLIVMFFKWLKSEKKVERIMKVVVKDNHESPCSDEVIEKALSAFGVQYLDWDRTDLRSKTIKDTMENVRELSLYSSGNDAVLRGWADQGGLKQLPVLRKVHLTVTQGLDSLQRTEGNVADFIKQFQNLEIHNKILPRITPPKDDPESKRKRTSAEQTGRHRWLRWVQDFTEGMAVELSKSPPIKVALIDDGVELHDEIFSNIEDGTSYAQPISPTNGPDEFFHSTRGHGTIMARIICKACPSVKLYVAKLNDTGGQGRFTMKYAAKAIEWAVSNEVDIISMSWTIDAADTDDINALKRAVERAGENGIIMYCAAKDEGKDAAKKEIYPYDSGPKVIKRIGATDSFGKKLRYVLERDTDYFLPGEDLTEQLPLQGTASVEETKNHREGSSEATALAAGLAALILACFAEVEGKKGIEYMRTSEHMNRVFDALAEYESMKYVMVWGFEASVKQKIPLPTNNARLAINGPQSDMKERMSRVANYCRRVIDHPGSVRSRNP